MEACHRTPRDERSGLVAVAGAVLGSDEAIVNPVSKWSLCYHTEDKTDVRKLPPFEFVNGYCL